MRELTEKEIQEVNGGADWEVLAAGLTIVSLGVVMAGTAGLATVPISLMVAATGGEILTAVTSMALAAGGGFVIGEAIITN
jgi:hypothetical protein